MDPLYNGLTLKTPLPLIHGNGVVLYALLCHLPTPGMIICYILENKGFFLKTLAKNHYLMYNYTVISVSDFLEKKADIICVECSFLAPCGDRESLWEDYAGKLRISY